jgi:hypothetical protein
MKRAQVSPLRITRRGFTFEWHGGEYIEISSAGPGGGEPFDVINVTRADGTRPEFTRDAFAGELAEVDYSELRTTLREMRY